MSGSFCNTLGYSFSERKEILSIYRKYGISVVHKYAYIFQWKFSPLEYQVWCALRSTNLITSQFRPEYPVYKYFVDFGHPVLGIAIEVDSKKHHSDINSERDKIRQKVIENHGWYVIRVTPVMVLSNIYDKNIDACENYEDERELIESNKHRCIDCYLRSEQFNKIIDERSPRLRIPPLIAHNINYYDGNILSV